MYLTISGVKVVSKKNKMRYGKGKVYKHTSVSQWEDVLREEAVKVWGDRELLTSDVQVHIKVHVPDRRRRDIHNFPDVICDVLEGICYKDDSQITNMTLQKVYDKSWHVEISIKAAT